jgi:hypothetical protein
MNLAASQFKLPPKLYLFYYQKMEKAEKEEIDKAMINLKTRQTYFIQTSSRAI